MSEGSRSAKYESSGDASSTKEERITRLKFELREHIRFLSDFKLLSKDWLKMAESLHQIANVAFMETHLPAKENNPLQQSGKKDQGTLWDQEKDELAIRILLEEGKLNLVLRILHAYMVSKRNGEVEKKISDGQLGLSPEKVQERCQVTEQALGVLLKFSLKHVEALQIVDVVELLQHAGEVLKDGVKEEAKESEGGSDSDKMQSTLVVHYLCSLAENMENLDEDRIVDLMQQNGIVPTLALIFGNPSLRSQYSEETQFAAAKTISSFMESDSYGTDPTDYVDKASAKLICSMEESIAEFLKKGAKKKTVQKLLDQIAAFKRKGYNK